MPKPIVRLKSWAYSAGRLYGRVAAGSALVQDTEIYDTVVTAWRHDNGTVMAEAPTRVYQLAPNGAEQRLLDAVSNRLLKIQGTGAHERTSAQF